MSEDIIERIIDEGKGVGLACLVVVIENFERIARDFAGSSLVIESVGMWYDSLRFVNGYTQCESHESVCSTCVKPGVDGQAQVIFTFKKDW